MTQEIKRIAIFRALQLGDLLCSIPAMRALKSHYSEASFSLIGLPWSEKFVSRFSEYFTDHISFPGYPGLPEQPFNAASYTDFVKRVNEEKFDLLIQMHGNGSIINPMLSTLGAKHYAGFREPKRYCHNEKTFLNYPENSPEILRHIKLVEFLGIPHSGVHLEFPVHKEEESKYITLQQTHSLENKKYVCIHPGARDLNRRWPAEYFASMADLFVSKGYKVVLTGTDDERETVNAVKQLMNNKNTTDLTGQTEQGTLALIIRNAAMLFSNDTGVSHLAAAFKTPSVIIYLTSDPQRWAPLNLRLHKRVLSEQAVNIQFVKEVTEQVLHEQESSININEGVL